MNDALSSRKLPVALIVSLLINFLLVGLVLGGTLAKRGGGPPGPRIDEGAFARHIVEAAPLEARDETRRAFRSVWADARDLRRDRDTARRAVGDLIRSETYDAEALKAAFADLRAADAALEEKIQTVIAERLAYLSVEERQALAERMRGPGRGRMRGERLERLREWRERRGDGPPDDPED